MRIFISYSRENNALAEQLAAHLTELGHDVWYSEGCLNPGENFAAQIGKALEQSDAMIVLITPESMSSEWVRGEVNFALSSPKYAWRVVPVVVKPTDKIPWILEKLQMIRAGKNISNLTQRILATLQPAEK